MYNKIKRGYFAIYAGAEYRIGKTFPMSINIVTANVDLAKDGFREIEKGLFVKKVSKRDITDAYYVYPKIVYKGDEFEIAGQNDEVVFGFTYDRIVAARHTTRPGSDREFIVEIPYAQIGKVIERIDTINLYEFEH